MKKHVGALITGILVLSFVSQANTIISVIMADVARTFPDASLTELQLVMQFGMIGGVPMALIVGFLRKWFSVKQMTLTGTLLILIGGVVPIFFHASISTLFICAFIVGAGQGIVQALLGVLVLQNFIGNMQNRMLGFKTTFAVGGASVLLALAGPIATTGWVHVYYIYLLAIPAFIIGLFCLPNDGKLAPTPKEEGKTKTPVPIVGWIWAIVLLFMFMSYVSFPLNISLYLDATALGGPVQTGFSMSLITIVGAALGVVFAPIIKKIRFFSPTFACVFGLLGMLLVILASNIGMIYAASVLLGIFFGMAVTCNGFIIFRICTPEQIAPTMSVCVAFINLGVVIAPFVVNPITALTSGAGAGAVGSFKTCIGFFVVMIVVTIIYGIFLQKKHPTDPIPVEESGESAAQ